MSSPKTKEDFLLEPMAWNLQDRFTSIWKEFSPRHFAGFQLNMIQDLKEREPRFYRMVLKNISVLDINLKT